MSYQSEVIIYATEDIMKHILKKKKKHNVEEPDVVLGDCSMYPKRSIHPEAKYLPTFFINNPEYTQNIYKIHWASVKWNICDLSRPGPDKIMNYLQNWDKKHKEFSDVAILDRDGYVRALQAWSFFRFGSDFEDHEHSESRFVEELSIKFISPKVTLDEGSFFSGYMNYDELEGL